MKWVKTYFNWKEWLVYFVLYLLLAGTPSWQEIVAGLVLALTAAFISGFLKRRAGGRIEIRSRWILLLARRTTLKVFTDTALVLYVLWLHLFRRKPIEGRLLFLPVNPGGDNAISRGRRALILAFSTLPPNVVSVFLDEKRKRLVVHQLHPTSSPPGRGDREWPL